MCDPMHEEVQTLEAEISGLKTEIKELKKKVKGCATLTNQAQREAKRLRALVWTPHTANFLEAVQIEAAHQRDRWGEDHDKEKDDQFWYWTLGYLAGKILKAPDHEKRLHHIVTSAALLLNWHRLAKEA